MEKYTPTPVNTDDIILPDDLDALKEKMAENVHEIWAQARMQQGWTYGPERNDTLKQHPCLVPYQLLPDEEKEYDRMTAIATLKLILKLGYTISKKF